MTCTKMKEEYLSDLETLRKVHQEKAQSFIEQGSNDEAVFEKIKENIIDIFYTLFNVSYKKSLHIDVEVDKLNNLAKVYNGFFEKLPKEWEQKMAKDKEHDNVDEYYKEKVKLDKAREIKELFKNYYDKYKLEI